MQERLSPQSAFGRSVFWLCFLTYGLHVIEDYDLGWQPAAMQVLGQPEVMLTLKQLLAFEVREQHRTAPVGFATGA